MSLYSWMRKKCGYVRCRVCGEWTKPSTTFFDLCSPECLFIERVTGIQRKLQYWQKLKGTSWQKLKGARKMKTKEEILGKELCNSPQGNKTYEDFRKGKEQEK